jgi:hypothetical protein
MALIVPWKIDCAGAGISFGSKWGGKFFAEGRYVRIYTGDYHTDYLPVTFGFRH